MKKHFEAIKKTYHDHRDNLLRKGRLPLKDTGIGYWGISDCNELFELFQKINLKQSKSFMDLGAGDGRATIIASLFTNAAGIECDHELHEWCEDFKKQHEKRTKNKIEFTRGNFLEHDLSLYDTLFIHPDQPISRALEEKLKTDMQKNAKLIVFGPIYHPEELNKIETHDIQGTLVSVFEK